MKQPFHSYQQPEGFDMSKTAPAARTVAIAVPTSVVPACVLELKRAQRRLKSYNDTIELWLERVGHARSQAELHEDAKLGYLDSLSPSLRRDLGYE